MQTNRVSLASIRINEANPRTITDDKFNKLITSLLVFPRMLSIRPIVVDRQSVALGGNMRYRALSTIAEMTDEELCARLAADRKYQRLTKVEQEDLLVHWQAFRETPMVDIICADDLSGGEYDEFIIKDNASFGAWDYDELTANFDEADLLDWGLDVWDTEPEDEGEHGAGKDDDYEIPEEVKTTIAQGDLFEIGEHRLLCGDSTDKDAWGRLMPGEQADLVVTDPPYNVDYVGKTKDALKIENDKKSDSDFYDFLVKFYDSLAHFTKRGGGMVCMARGQRRGEFQARNGRSGHSCEAMPDMGEKYFGDGPPGLSLAARAMLIWVERRGGTWMVQRSQTDDALILRPADPECGASHNEAGTPNRLPGGK